MPLYTQQLINVYVTSSFHGSAIFQLISCDCFCGDREARSFCKHVQNDLASRSPQKYTSVQNDLTLRSPKKTRT